MRTAALVVALLMAPAETVKIDSMAGFPKLPYGHDVVNVATNLVGIGLNDFKREKEDMTRDIARDINRAARDAAREVARSRADRKGMEEKLMKVFPKAEFITDFVEAHIQFAFNEMKKN
jgi:hypothetical protein